MKYGWLFKRVRCSFFLLITNCTWMCKLQNFSSQLRYLIKKSCRTVEKLYCLLDEMLVLLLAASKTRCCAAYSHSETLLLDSFTSTKIILSSTEAFPVLKQPILPSGEGSQNAILVSRFSI